MNFKEIEKYCNETQDIKIKCPYCGRKNSTPAYVESRICYWCKKKIINNTRARFKYMFYKTRKEKNEKNSIKEKNK